MVERETEKNKKRSLRNEKLKANRASVTEEQRRERLRIRREKDRAKRTKKNYKRKKKRSSVTEDNENQCQATLKRLKQGDENELERNLRLEKVVASKQLKFAMETDVEPGEDGSNHTAQVGPGDGGRKKSKKRNEFNLDLISNTFFSSRNELARPVMGTIFLVVTNNGDVS